MEWRAIIMAVMLAALLTATFGSRAATNSLAKFSLRFSTNTSIVWQGATTSLPKSFWIYKRILPHVFPAAVISNAIVLASYQSKGFPPPSTNRVIIWDSTREGDDPLAGNFVILPDEATIQYVVKLHALGSVEGIPSDKVIVQRAWSCAALLGLDHAQLVQTSIQTNMCEYDAKGQMGENNIGGHSVFLRRRLEGIEFFGDGNGFEIEFGSDGKIRSFELNWPKVERETSKPTASREEITECIRAHKIVVLPEPGEERYFQRLEALARTKRLVITKITPYYGDGVFGEVPANDEPPKFITPFAEVKAVAEFGSSNAPVRFCAPILAAEVRRLLR